MRLPPSLLYSFPLVIIQWLFCFFRCFLVLLESQNVRTLGQKYHIYKLYINLYT